MTKRVPLKQRDLDLIAMPSIASQFPVVFANGAEMTRVVGMCNCCDADIPNDVMTGAVTRPTPKVAVVEAVGYCAVCNIYSRFDYRLHDDMRMSGKDKQGRWAEWRMRRTFMSALRHLLGIKTSGT